MSLALDAPAPVGFGEKIWRINWGLILVLTAIAAVWVVALYSAAGGRFEPWAARHAMRYGMVKLDGADNTFQYFLSETEPGRLRVGQTVRAVFREERTGSLADLLHFAPVEE